jgi:hypothetical protein
LVCSRAELHPSTLGAGQLVVFSGRNWLGEKSPQIEGSIA